MIIPKELPQFKGETALLIVSGTKQAKIYRASDSVLEVIDECKVETPKYSDNEGRFGSSSGSAIIASGNVLEDVHKQAEQSFIRELATNLKNAGKIFSSSIVYVFAPAHVKNAVMRTIPTTLKKNVQFVFSGNYAKAAPTAIMQKIKKVMDINKVMPTSEDAQRILNLPRQMPSAG